MIFLMKITMAYRSSTSWNTQLGVCVVVKMRLSVGILGALRKRKHINVIIEVNVISNRTGTSLKCYLSKAGLKLEKSANFST